jgi:hypothetical protein
VFCAVWNVTVLQSHGFCAPKKCLHFITHVLAVNSAWSYYIL